MKIFWFFNLIFLHIDMEMSAPREQPKMENLLTYRGDYQPKKHKNRVVPDFPPIEKSLFLPLFTRVKTFFGPIL